MAPKKIKKLEVMVADVIRETPDTSTLIFFTGNDTLDYKPGHFCTIAPQQFDALARWTAYLEDRKGRKEPPRAYSLASAPHEKHLAITVKEERYVSGVTDHPPLLSPPLVYRTQPGSRMEITGFTGPYVMPDDIEDRTDHVVHICAGSGIVPNWSMLKHCLAANMKLKHTLIYGNKTWQDVIYRKGLEDLEKAYPGKVKVVHALSREEGLESNGG
ncbi:MAG: oxidoreductase, partial [Deltaproteobacteria bacterium]